MKKHILNGLLLISFIVTMLVPLTGIIVHKIASLIFLILCLIHILSERRKMNGRRWALCLLILVDFASGMASLIMESEPGVLAFHRIVSMLTLCFLAIHIFVYRGKIMKREKQDKK